MQIACFIIFIIIQDNDIVAIVISRPFGRGQLTPFTIVIILKIMLLIICNIQTNKNTLISNQQTTN